MKERTQELKSEHEGVLRAARGGWLLPTQGTSGQRAAEGLTDTLPGPAGQ